MRRPSIDHSSDRSLYRQLADILRAQITSGELAPGRTLQSEAHLGHEHGVSQTTVRKALAVLRAESLVEAGRGMPWRVAQKEEMTVVAESAGARVSWRMATSDDRERHGIAEGTPVLVVSRPDQPDELHPADRTVIEFSDDH